MWTDDAELSRVCKMICKILRILCAEKQKYIYVQVKKYYLNGGNLEDIRSSGCESKHHDSLKHAGKHQNSKDSNNSGSNLRYFFVNKAPRTMFRRCLAFLKVKLGVP
jgi:hypothetical protein